MTQPVSQLPEFLNGLVYDLNEVLEALAKRIKERMAAPVPPRTPGEKVNWDGEIDPIRNTTRQQRAYFASNGFGNGIPYRPSGRFALNWQATRTEFGTRLEAPHPAGAIGGMPDGWQSKIHKGRRPNLALVLLEEVSKVPDEIRTKFSIRAGK